MADDIVTRLRQRAIYRMNPIAKAVGLGIDDFIETEAADEIERLLADVNRWRALADRMHDELVKNWCWHCGHEKTRNIYVSDLLEDYRQSVIDSGVFNEVTDGL